MTLLPQFIIMHRTVLRSSTPKLSQYCNWTTVLYCPKSNTQRSWRSRWVGTIQTYLGASDNASNHYVLWFSILTMLQGFFCLFCLCRRRWLGSVVVKSPICEHPSIHIGLVRILSRSLISLGIINCKGKRILATFCSKVDLLWWRRKF
jgi:hypothetical protein